MAKSYVFTKGGTGNAPHVLTNPDDPNDTIALCACGGTRNPEGDCDGTHHKKQPLGCCCWFCKKQEDRVGKEMTQERCTACE